MTSPRLQGKNAIITGAGSGIGAQIALAFAKEGARVCVADVNAYSADAVAQEIRSVGGTAIGIR
ncbi:SDR family NAD(P)-dependent oxidoreductase, partial [Pelomicrobium sp. G1]|uniref:SDR family NAD(P)-dependent oxidoreductase n=1 Tax=Pelomicrobium sp. G1 TaxID=3452920 RepID=UPI003F7712D8